MSEGDMKPKQTNRCTAIFPWFGEGQFAIRCNRAAGHDKEHSGFIGHGGLVSWFDTDTPGAGGADLVKLDEESAVALIMQLRTQVNKLSAVVLARGRELDDLKNLFFAHGHELGDLVTEDE